mmetsp:Transcript_12752/g.37082  ORF Transcript_12752/g.37082 Transcript_12752/m.37082 type:complete len:242 (-) Transcript_12752:53-778(-)|eukprot:CAMPEP_0119545804 /NCGR_PEP_ID=MMETSP1352-20130426/453_1 /TAXON_ID=265584 /ORGANISM="Stauroneis constricta, Strain CCMP1120" /LENGTH=241 /DNA_ID=CAMNT_0007590407 /DNA_START=237 /DNA_END=962 /DNA_ORIENTATION=+
MSNDPTEPSKSDSGNNAAAAETAAIVALEESMANLPPSSKASSNGRGRRSSFLKIRKSTKGSSSKHHSSSKTNKSNDNTTNDNATPGLRSCLKKTDTKITSSSKEVSFDTIEIYCFLISIGDNPSCEGAPICISNGECIQNEIYNIQQYEEFKPKKKSRKALVISPSRRSKILLSLGYTIEDIATIALETQKIRQDRMTSFENKKWDRFSMIAESTKNKLKRMVGTTKPDEKKNSVISRVA